MYDHRAKRGMSASAGLVDFAAGLVGFTVHLLNGQVKVFGENFEETKHA